MYLSLRSLHRKTNQLTHHTHYTCTLHHLVATPKDHHLVVTSTASSSLALHQTSKPDFRPAQVSTSLSDHLACWQILPLRPYQSTPHSSLCAYPPRPCLRTLVKKELSSLVGRIVLCQRLLLANPSFYQIRLSTKSVDFLTKITTKSVVVSTKTITSLLPQVAVITRHPGFIVKHT